MNKQILLLSALALFFAVGCGADKNSNDACLYEATMSLDKGNYDAVLASSCADSMQKGAAYLGKAGYDVKDVINRFSSTSATTGTQTDLNVYMNSLTGKVTEATLTNLDNAKTQYQTILASSSYYKDSQFYISVVDAVKGLSLLKIVTDSTGFGTVASCDINNNTVFDEGDATSCALTVGTGVGGACTGVSGATYTATSDITIVGKNPTNNYRGVTITLTGTASPSCPSPATYKKLLYKDGSGNYWMATTESGTGCTDGTGTSWPCPIEQSGAPLDLVTTLQSSINSAVTSMGDALPGTTSADVQKSINEIQTQACGTDKVCTSAEVANYLQTYLK